MRDDVLEETQFSMPGHHKGSAEYLKLDPLAMRHMLTRIRELPTLDALRYDVQALICMLDDPTSNIRTPQEESIELSRTYIIEDLTQISCAQTLDRARYYIDRFVRSMSAVKTTAINDINLHRWKEYNDIHTDSLWMIERRVRTNGHHASYWGNFVPQIPNQMMRRYTKPGDWVLDTFAGSGTSLIEGMRLGRNTLGVELQERMVDQVRQQIDTIPNPHQVQAQVYQGDSTTIDFGRLLAQHGQESAQLVLMHPPYFDIIKFSDDPRDLSNSASVDDFLEMIGRLVDNVSPYLDQGRYLVLVIGDKYAKGDWIPLGFHAMNEVMQRGFSLKSIVVKNFEETSGKRAQKELWRYRALLGGFYVFKHEYIFLFRKQ